MARQLRIEYENAFYHVLSRGNNKKEIFKNEADRNKFLKIISEAHDKYKILIHSYVLMKNHYHMIIQTPVPNLSKAMQYINSKYTGYFNYANKEVGHLFQGRYKAILVEKDEYLLPLSRYIHLNPVRADYVKKPQEYQWSSFKIFLDDYDNAKWLVKKFILNAIGSKDRYKEYVMEFEEKEIENPFLELKGQTFLCGDAFLEKVKKERDNIEKTIDTEIIDKKFLENKITCEEIIEKITAAFKISRREIITRNIYSNKYRKLAVYLCKKHTGETNFNIGKYFGIKSGCVSSYFKWGQTFNIQYLLEKLELSGEKLIEY